MVEFFSAFSESLFFPVLQNNPKGNKREHRLQVKRRFFDFSLKTLVQNRVRCDAKCKLRAKNIQNRNRREDGKK